MRNVDIYACKKLCIAYKAKHDTHQCVAHDKVRFRFCEVVVVISLYDHFNGAGYIDDTKYQFLMLWRGRSSTAGYRRLCISLIMGMPILDHRIRSLFISVFPNTYIDNDIPPQIHPLAARSSFGTNNHHRSYIASRSLRRLTHHIPHLTRLGNCWHRLIYHCQWHPSLYVVSLD